MGRFDKYLIDIDHCTPATESVAMEGFFRDDKNPQIQEEAGSNNVKYSYGDKAVYGPSGDYSVYTIKNWSKTTKAFLTKGINVVSIWVTELEAASRYVDSVRTKWEQACDNKDVEKQREIMSEMKKHLRTLIETNRAANNGNQIYSGELVETTEPFLSKMKNLIDRVVVVYNRHLKAGFNTSVKMLYSQSTLKKLFIKSHSTKTEAYKYLDCEMTLFVMDVIANIRTYSIS